MTAWGILLAAGFAAVGLAAPRIGLLALWRRFQAHRERTRAEDALKHILAWQDRSKPASVESLAGGLRLKPSAALHLATRLEAAGWVECGAAGIELTRAGKHRALQVVRAHRLWERHLSDDANMPIGRLHQAAERAEHSLSKADVARLDAHLGHPQHDPHGDPIPSADGSIDTLDAVSLNDWPSGAPARIAHIEDEPDAVFREILATGLRPSQVVRILEADAASLRLEFEGKERRIGRALAINIQVAAVRQEDLLPADALRLSDLGKGSGGWCSNWGRNARAFRGDASWISASRRGPACRLPSTTRSGIREHSASGERRSRCAVSRPNRSGSAPKPVPPLRRQARERHDCEACPAHAQLAQMGIDIATCDYVVALAGNPNTGKSSVFNALTGLRQHVGNWTGKTVTRAEGAFGFAGNRYKLVDLPGTYSLLSASQDEEISRNFLLFGQAGLRGDRHGRDRARTQPEPGPASARDHRPGRRLRQSHGRGAAQGP